MSNSRFARELLRGQVVRETSSLVTERSIAPRYPKEQARLKLTEDGVFRTTPKHSACLLCRDSHPNKMLSD